MKTKALFVALTTLFIVSLSFWACQKDEIKTGNPDTTEQVELKTQQADAHCPARCIQPTNPEYYEISNHQTISWAGSENDKFSKTVSINYYNTLTHFVLRIKSTNGIADVLIDGQSVKNFEGTIAKDTWHQISFPLQEGWQGCQQWSFELKVTGNGPAATFGVQYFLIGMCTEDMAADINGNVYKTVVIGNQTWMAENLKATKYLNGDAIITGLSNYHWSITTSGGYAVYPHGVIDGINSESEMVEKYGRLYNWYAVNDFRGICPAGWHVPTDGEWSALITYLTYSNAGGSLKSTFTAPDPHPRWNSPNLAATNSSGFSALPGSFRFINGNYGELGISGQWWSSTMADGTAWIRLIEHNSSNVLRGTSSWRAGYSVRCIKPVLQ
jgi:uncharacterized protein (TIGR02145 family)